MSDFLAPARAVLQRPEVRGLCVDLPFESPDGREGTYKALVTSAGESQGTDMTSLQVRGFYVRFLVLWEEGMPPPAYDYVTYLGRVYQVQEVTSIAVGGDKPLGWQLLATVA